MRAKRALVTTLTLLTMTALVVILLLGFAAPAKSPVFWAPTPLLISSSEAYGEWLAYHYTQVYLSTQSYTLDEKSYNTLLQNLGFNLKGSRLIVFHVDGATFSAVLNNVYVSYTNSSYGPPVFTVDSVIYVSSEGALINYSYTVTLPIRFYLVQEFLGALANIPNNSSVAVVEEAVYTLVNQAQGVSATLTIQNLGQTSYVNIELVDCYLQAYYQTCPTYLGSEILNKVLPNLTLSFSSTQPGV
ncbi:MAG: hypothetical protein QW514_00650 [Thermoprotei archaeon]